MRENKPIKKCMLLLMTAILIMIIGLLGACNANENRKSLVEQEILDVFDSTDPKDNWNGSFRGVQFDIPIAIFITFRRVRDGAEHPLLEARHFGLNNIRTFYFNQFPPTHWEDQWPPFRQTAQIILTSNTQGDLRAAIRYLESLCFVKSARAENYASPHNNIE
jgi:hypothetical protein